MAVSRPEQSVIPPANNVDIYSSDIDKVDIDVAPFEPAPRRATGLRATGLRATGSIPAEPMTLDVEAIQAQVQTSITQATAIQTTPPNRTSTSLVANRPPIRPVSATAIATLEPPTPASPWAEDDPFSTPDHNFANSNSASSNSASSNSASSNSVSSVNSSAPKAKASKPELYVVEAITEEPNWDDVGDPNTTSSGPPDLEDAPYANYSVERPTPKFTLKPTLQLAPQPNELKPEATALKAGAPARIGDIRAHPMYEHIKDRFPGRMKEMGKNRNIAPVVAESDLLEEEKDSESDV